MPKQGNEIDNDDGPAARDPRWPRVVASNFEGGIVSGITKRSIVQDGERYSPEIEEQFDGPNHGRNHRRINDQRG
jgi:hypothetical protein